MIDNSKSFKYNGINLSEFGDIRIVSSSTGMYQIGVTGTKTIIEESIPGKSTPYFYGVDFKPQTLSITVALEQPKTIIELRSLFTWLLSVDSYKPLIFDADPTKIYYAMFTGEPKFTYVEKTKIVDDVVIDALIGTITLTARCNSHSGYAGVREITKDAYTSFFPITNYGDEATYTNLEISFAAGFSSMVDEIIITNNAGGSEISFTGISTDADGYLGTYINVDVGTRIIESDIENIYDKWNRQYLSLEVGNSNDISIVFKKDNVEVPVVQNSATIKFEFQPVRYF